MNVPNKILVSVDFSDSSRAALDYAALLADRLGAELDVLHVWKPPVFDAGVHDDPLAAFAESDSGHKMAEWLVACGRPGAEAHGRLAAAAPSDVPRTIVEIAENGAYDLVVIGANASHPWSHVFRDSVTQSVVRTSPCPVITVRAEDVPPAGAPAELDEAVVAVVSLRGES